MIHWSRLSRARSTASRCSTICTSADFMKELRRSGVAGLLDPIRRRRRGSSFAGEESPRLLRQATQPTANVLNRIPIQDIDFESGGAYAQYNWELFFHIPLLIAAGFAEPALRGSAALVSLHLRPDQSQPRGGPAAVLEDQAVLPRAGRADRGVPGAGRLDGGSGASGPREYDRQIEAWRKIRSTRTRIARLRTTAYQKTLVMKYLDNLIAWGDQLFRQDTIESINEATQLYVLALRLLGERPDALPPRSSPVATTFEQVRIDLASTVLNNPLVRLENLVPPSQRNARVELPAARTTAGSTELARHCGPPRPGSTRVRRAHCQPTFYFAPAEREAARLLGHGRRSPVQDPPLHEHRGRRAPAAAVRAADRPGPAGPSARRGHRSVERAGRPERAAAALPVQR